MGEWPGILKKYSLPALTLNFYEVLTLSFTIILSFSSLRQKQITVEDFIKKNLRPL